VIYISFLFFIGRECRHNKQFEKMFIESGNDKPSQRQVSFAEEMLEEM